MSPRGTANPKARVCDDCAGWFPMPAHIIRVVDYEYLYNPPRILAQYCKACASKRGLSGRFEKEEETQMSIETDYGEAAEA